MHVQAGQMNGSEMLLNNAERYGLLVASSSNGSNSEDSVVRQSRLNIGNNYKTYLLLRRQYIVAVFILVSRMIYMNDQSQLDL